MSVYIIGEAGVNHNGSIDIAKKLIDAAAESGADAVKFQMFDAGAVVSRNARKAAYQLTEDNDDLQYDMLKKLELKRSSFVDLLQYSRARGIDFLVTPFDLDSVHFLVKDLDLPRLKIASGEITNAPLLLAVAMSGKPVVLSTGMSTLKEIKTALAILAFGYLRSKRRPSLTAFYGAYASMAGRRAIREKVALLHCTSEYPAPFSDVNLRAMDTLYSVFKLPVGLSDHTTGYAIAVAAAARGAGIIEKHFTLDRAMLGPDHKASLEPGELCAMVRSIREVEQALGDLVKKPAPSETKNISIVRRSLVAGCDIEKGALFTEQNLCIKRPGTGVSPLYYWQWLGKKAKKGYKKDEIIS